MVNDTKNFKASEFKCSCCGKNETQQETIDLAQKIRDYIGKPMHISSGYRCDAKQEDLRKTNKNAAKKRSAHEDGLAFDFCITGMSASDIGSKIKEMYHKGLIPEIQYSYLISSTAVHVGLDKKNRYQIFAY